MLSGKGFDEVGANRIVMQALIKKYNHITSVIADRQHIAYEHLSALKCMQLNKLLNDSKIMNAMSGHLHHPDFDDILKLNELKKLTRFKRNLRYFAFMNGIDNKNVSAKEFIEATCLDTKTIKKIDTALKSIGMQQLLSSGRLSIEQLKSASIKQLKILTNPKIQNLLQCTLPIQEQPILTVSQALALTKVQFKALTANIAYEDLVHERKSVDSVLVKTNTDTINHLIQKLQAYVDRIDSYKLKDKSTTNFNHFSFPFFRPSRGYNRQLNYITAKSLISSLDKCKGDDIESVANLFYKDSIIKLRDEAALTVGKGYKRNIHSSELNSIFKEADKLLEPRVIQARSAHNLRRK